MSFFSKIGNAIKGAAKKIGGAVSKVAAPLSIATLAIPGAGPFISKAVATVGAAAGGLKAKVDGVSQTTNSIAGGLASAAATGYVQTAGATVDPITGQTLQQQQTNKLLLIGGGIAALVVLPQLLGGRKGRR